MDFASELIEKQALQQLHEAASAELRQDLGLQLHEIGSAMVSVASALPDSAIVINRTVGLGVWETATPAILDSVLAAYRDAAVAQYFIHLHPQSQPTALADWLIARGVPATRGWQKFERGPGELPETRSDLKVRRVGTEHGNDLARIVCDAFDLGDLARPWLARLPDCPDWHTFMAFDGDAPAGTGSVFIRDGMAWMDFAGTAPAFRQRGCQGALIAARVAFALEQGCTRLFTCTGVAVPGDPQHSYKNIERAGFRSTYVRDNHAPPEA